MSEENERLARLERRITLLEAQMRALHRSGAVAGEPSPPTGDSAPAAPPPAGAGAPPAAPSPPARGARPTAPRPAASASGGRGADRDLERWLGENGLLAVGLLALVTAAGFFLKYAFDQGWVSPGARVVAGLVGGVGLAAYGERLQRKELVRYGASLVGGGAAIAYLALWAGAGPYQLIAPGLGVAGLALFSLLVLASAVTAGVELLAAAACAGAFLAPVILSGATGSAAVLLAYVWLVAAAGGIAAALMGWGLTFALVVAGFYLLPAGTVGSQGGGAQGLHAAYLFLGTPAALVVARLRRWRGGEALAFLSGWGSLLFLAGSAAGAAAWLLLLGLPLVVAPSFAIPLLGRDGTGGGATGSRDAAPDGLYLVLATAGWAGASVLGAPGLLGAHPFVLPLLVSLPYLAVSARRREPLYHALAFGLLAWSASLSLGPVAECAAWAGLAALSGVLTRPASLASARWAGFGLAAVAGYWLLQMPDPVRGEGAVFFGSWALSLYLVILVLAALAGFLWGEEPEGRQAGRVAGLRSAMWIAAGLLLLAGGTQEILDHFARFGTPADTLVRDLSVSAFWLVYAGALIAAGFLRDARPVRVAGLVVSGLALVKVVLYDLTRLQALYRIGSFFLLALMALGGAYAYHQRSRREAEAAPADVDAGGSAAEP